MKHLKFIFVFLIIVSQTLYSQSSMTIYPLKDAYTEAKNGKANYNGQNIKLGYQSPPNYNQFYPVFFFQMPNNINSSQVDSAKLYLTKIEGSGTQTEVVGLYITANWEENSITSNWLNSNVNYTGFDKVNNVTGDLVFPMTIAVKKWLDNPSTNFGFTLYPQAFSPTTVFTYYDRENGAGFQKPRLTIWYKGNNYSLIEFDDFVIRIFPNPSDGSDYININLTVDKLNTIEIKLFEYNGRIVSEIKIVPEFTGIFNQKIYIGDLSQGVYFLQVNKNGIVSTKPFIINK